MEHALKNTVVMVSGAGRGIGQAVAVALAEEGAGVVLVARSETELAETAARIGKLGRDAVIASADVSELEQVKRAVAQGIERFSRIDVLVNCAGRQPPIGPIWENDPEDWFRTVAVNLVGTFHCIRAVLPGMMQRRQGKIINFSGGGAASPRPNFSAHAASKAAVVRLTETVAEELRPYNIQVNAVAPGAVNTRMLDEVLAAGDAAGAELAAAEQRKSTGGTPAELAAQLVVFLASGASGGLTGKLISAPHDDWRNWTPDRLARLDKTPWYTLRRID